MTNKIIKDNFHKELEERVKNIIGKYDQEKAQRKEIEGLFGGLEKELGKTFGESNENIQELSDKYITPLNEDEEECIPELPDECIEPLECNMDDYTPLRTRIPDDNIMSITYDEKTFPAVYNIDRFYAFENEKKDDRVVVEIKYKQGGLSFGENDPTEIMLNPAHCQLVVLDPQSPKHEPILAALQRARGVLKKRHSSGFYQKTK